MSLHYINGQTGMYRGVQHHMFNVLLVEGDQKLSLSFSSFLESQGYEVIATYGPAEALAAYEKNHVDIVVSDVTVANTDNIPLFREIRKVNPDLPIIVISDHGDLQSKQRAFSAEIDDYMVKPVDLNELILRMSALLRRAHTVSKHRLIVGDAVLDSDTLTVVEGPTVTTLPPKEFQILLKLCSSFGRIFSRRDIMDDIWGVNSESGERTVDVHIKRLRKRFQNSKSFRIETVRGVGYKATSPK